MFRGNSQKEARSNGEKRGRFAVCKIAADILIAFAGECFTEEIEDTESLKYCWNWSQFVSTRHDSDKPEKVNISILSGCCRLWTLRHHSTFQVKILNLFYFIYFQKSEFSGSAFRYHENSDRVWRIQNWLQFDQHYSHSVSSISSYILKAFVREFLPKK